MTTTTVILAGEMPRSAVGATFLPRSPAALMYRDVVIPWRVRRRSGRLFRFVVTITQAMPGWHIPTVDYMLRDFTGRDEGEATRKALRWARALEAPR